MKVFVIYDTKYGNTKAVAGQIAEGLREVGEVEATMDLAKTVDPQKLLACDALIVGAPNHMGKPSRAIIKFVDGLSGLEVKAKWGAAFDTYFQRQHYFMKATRKLEKHVSKKLPNLKLIDGLSIKVIGVNGPIADGELVKAKEFGKKTAQFLTSQTETKRIVDASTDAT